jgi:hypothetical protein
MHAEGNNSATSTHSYSGILRLGKLLAVDDFKMT